MIDIETQVFDAVKRSIDPVRCIPEYQNTTAQFPTVTIEETSNTVYEKTSDSGHIENHARVSYEVNVYSNKTDGKKQEAKQIMSDVDDAMEEIGFTRNFCSSVPNLADSTIYRITARYTAVVGKDEKIYRR